MITICISLRAPLFWHLSILLSVCFLGKWGLKWLDSGFIAALPLFLVLPPTSFPFLKEPCPPALPSPLPATTRDTLGTLVFTHRAVASYSTLSSLRTADVFILASRAYSHSGSSANTLNEWTTGGEITKYSLALWQALWQVQGRGEWEWALAHNFFGLLLKRFGHFRGRPMALHVLR